MNPPKSVEELKADCLKATTTLFPDLHAVGVGRQNWEVDGANRSQFVLILPSGQLQKINLEVSVNGPAMPDWVFYTHVLSMLEEEADPKPALPLKRQHPLDAEAEQAAEQLLVDGVEMADARRILNSHLNKVRAVLLRGQGHWLLGTNLPTQEKTIYPSFSQAFDAALTLLEQRAGHGAVVVTSADDVVQKLKNDG